ncbi:MAG: allophanate hydrolase subunit 1 [Mangrovicoccus sp.]|nr:allophanate hydrolase subunit 1 [Mangrovicoccus sp.]
MTDAFASKSTPQILRMGLSDFLVRFDDRLSDQANRAVLSLAAALEAEAWPGLVELAPSLAALYLRMDPAQCDPCHVEAKLQELLATRDWFAAPLPPGRRIWQLPCVFGGAAGPQLAEAAALAGCAPDQAIAQICAKPLRVLALGFSPGQPYLGSLPTAWDIPRQTELTQTVPVGAVVVAVRQIIIFTAPSPTGWRQIGQSGFRGFQPKNAPPILLRPGDEVQLRSVSAEAFAAMADTGGICEPLP